MILLEMSSETVFEKTRSHEQHYAASLNFALGTTICSFHQSFQQCFNHSTILRKEKMCLGWGVTYTIVHSYIHLQSQTWTDGNQPYITN